MDYRRLGRSGLQVPVLSFGTGTFAGKGPLFEHWGQTRGDEADRLIDICLEAGVTLFDSADVYSDGDAETAFGAAIRGRRNRLMISTKLGLPMGEGPNEAGTSRHRILAGTDDALRRLGTDHIDILQLHAFDAGTPVEETLQALDMVVRSGKVRYVGVSNYSGWQLMKGLAVADRYGYPRFVANQVYYSLVGRDYEWELMPLGAEEGVGALVWSPLGWGRLTGAVRRGRPLPDGSRLHDTADLGPPVDEERLYSIVDVLDQISAETGRSIPQIAINWLTTRPTVSSVILGARNERQLRDNLGAIGWALSEDQKARLDAASVTPAPYPYFPYRRQAGAARLNPPMV
ncbi:aldo/keto reductase [Amorphus orientalis]|uniref:Aryl-alcohol dehydrogenase-like predicted oxidoreductase n=1 Tax=Amorphus orientalis TaxID=649198 RepID=A0AAE4AR84_9HYPH|nr:aldo/keto reductase [Amorphus orientalis]MDQ0313917.1 aryl-alcohol dehydrogenase-like predicted oxidoreductase [Amorphus orientalis]